MATADHTIRFSDGAWRRLERLAEREGVTPDEAAERAVEWALGPEDTGSTRTEGASVLDLLGNLVGSLEGPGDLSTNKAYLEGFGAPRGSRTRQPPAAGDDA